MPHGNNACMNVLFFCSSPPDKPVASLGPYTIPYIIILTVERSLKFIFIV